VCAYSSVQLDKSCVEKEFTSKVALVDPLVTDNISLDSIDCSEDKIRREINHVKINGSAGPDTIPHVSLMKIAPSKITPLFLLYIYLVFNAFISVGQVPAAWKTAIVTPGPIHKGGH